MYLTILEDVNNNKITKKSNILDNSGEQGSFLSEEKASLLAKEIFKKDIETVNRLKNIWKGMGYNRHSND